MNVIVRAVPEAANQRLVEAGFSTVEARIYAARGIETPAALSTELKCLLPPEGLKGIAAVAGRLADALIRREKILIVADYDADGATACATAVRGLRILGAVVDFIVPNRFEYGYGLTPEIVDLAARQSPDLIVTVDNGIASAPAVRHARTLGMDVVITDHHLPGDELPDALIVNPNQAGCGFASKSLAGVGVMFYTLLALRAELRKRDFFADRPEPNLADLLDLVALGTVADVVKLDANNRILVEQGLRRMRAGRAQPGIKAIFQASGRDIRRATATDLGFMIGPRLNAAGRLEDMSLGINCLTTDNPDAALQMARELDRLNRERRAIETDMQEVAQSRLDSIEAGDTFSLTVFDPVFHQGVVGLVASRLKERHHRPVMVFAEGKPGEIKGSGRSIPGLHLRDAIDLVAKRHPDMIARFGGHAAAAGLTLTGLQVEAFRLAFEQVCREMLNPGDLTRQVETDGELGAAEICMPLAERLEGSVWGQGFPVPRFIGRFRVASQRIVGEKHLKLRLEGQGGQLFEAMRFQHAEPLPDYIDAVYQLSINEYQGNRTLQLLVEHCV